MGEIMTRWRARNRDEGSALIVVLGTTMVLIILATVAATAAMNTNRVARHSSDWNQALAAAEAGVDDYLARLNKNDLYWQTATDCSNPAMKRPNVSSCAWGSGTPVGWVKVPGADRAEYHYEAETGSTPVNGTIKLTATGRVGTVTRSVQTVLRRGGFGEFLYYTVYEEVDPANDSTYNGSPRSTTWAANNCVRYWWPSSSPRHSDCVNIQFAGGDVINGPMHTNDRILTGGAVRFKGTTTTSWPDCAKTGSAKKCYEKAGGSNPIFEKGVSYRPEIELPTTIGDLRQYVNGTNPLVPRTGCLYTGPTRIKLIATSATHSTMEVWSPYSRTALNPGCGNAASFASSPNTSQTMTIPHNSLIIVQDIPASAPFTVKQNANGSCQTGTISVYPQADDWNETLSDARCRYGTLYVEGTLKGRLTLVADNNIIITDHLTYNGGKTGTDSLGLIAGNSVKIYHPVKKSGNNFSDMNRPESKGLFKNAVVHASILTLMHSFNVQAWDKGSTSGLGKLNLFGSFAQRYRGPVALTSGTGYEKNYEYDTRLRYAPPPYFLDPVRSSWGIKAYGEISAAY